jgi:hypothetical protein
MKRIFSIAAVFSLALARISPAATDDEVNARKAALDLAGAFSNDGFKLRDGVWYGAIKPKDSQFVQVNLYAGNQYWFTAGATGKAKKLAVTVFDENGKPVESESYQDGVKASAGFSPTASGAYIIRIQETEGEPASFCFLYSYK